MTGEARFRRMEGLPYQRLGDQLLVVDARAREVHLLNSTASRLWELIERDSTVGEIVGQLSKEYDVDTAEAGPQVEALLADFKAKGLLDA